MNIDKWCAEQCGVQIEFVDYFSIPTDHKNIRDGYQFTWTIFDPRCREIVREHFLIEMCRVSGSWTAFKYLIDEDASIEGHGKTIPEAEIECINAIYNQLNTMSEQPE